MTADVLTSDRRPSDRLAPLVRPLAGLTLIAVAVTLYLALVRSPEDRVLGTTIRILYVHAGAAFTAYLAYGVTAVGAVLYLWRRAPLWDRVALASAEWGVVLTTVTLVTGSLWGRVAQGWWWRWDDPRLTLTLMMWFLYAGYLILRQYTAGEQRARLSAVLAVIGVPAAVLNHFAVRLFRTFHPDSVLVREGGAAADAPFVSTVLVSVVTYALLYLTVLVVRVRLEARRDRLDARRAGGDG